MNSIHTVFNKKIESIEEEEDESVSRKDIEKVEAELIALYIWNNKILPNYDRRLII